MFGRVMVASHGWGGGGAGTAARTGLFGAALLGGVLLGEGLLAAPALAATGVVTGSGAGGGGNAATGGDGAGGAALPPKADVADPNADAVDPPIALAWASMAGGSTATT